MAGEVDSCSMTPPMSPMFETDFDYILESQEPSPVKMPLHDFMEIESCNASGCFMCGGRLDGVQRISFRRDSVLKSGQLQRKLSISKDDRSFNDTVTELFGFQFVPQFALSDQMERLFMFAKNCILEVQRSSTVFFDAGRSEALLEHRIQLKTFLNYINVYIQTYAGSEGGARDLFCTRLLSQLHSVLLYSGRLTTQSHLENESTKSGSASYHTFHLQLDIYWSLLDIFNTLHSKFPGFTTSQRLCVTQNGDYSEFTCFDQLVQIVFWDLVYLSTIKHDKLGPADYLKVSPFPCSCVAELFIFIIHLTSQQHSCSTDDSFWVRCHSVVQIMCENTDTSEQIQERDSDVFVNPPSTLPKNPIGCSMWLITHLAHLFTYDDIGNTKTLEPMDCNYLIVKNTLQKKLSQNSLTEAELRSFLHCCLSLSKIWKADTTIVVQLWEYFYRRLNNTFQLSGSNVEGLASVGQNTHFLLDQCKKWSSGQEDGIDKENSFYLFLRLLGWQLSRVVRVGSLHEWRQIKGRFFSKFHQRRMQELTELGLQNFSCLFLTLALTVELEDVANKLCSFYDMVEFSDTNIQKRSVVWLGGLALAQIYVERGMDMAFIADKLVTSFNSVCKEFVELGLDPSRRYRLWRMISLYLEATQDIFENSPSLGCSEHRLLGNGVGCILSVCRDSELRFTLMTLHSVFSTFRSMLLKVQSCHGDREKAQLRSMELQYIALSTVLWNEVCPFIKEHATTLTPPMCLADLAAVICLLSKDLPSLQSPTSSFKAIFHHFAGADGIHVGLSCHFVAQVVGEEGVLDWMLVNIPGIQVQLVQSWFRCVMLIPASFLELQNFTRIVTKLPEVQEMSSSANLTTDGGVEHTPKDFLKTLGKVYFRCENFREKMLVRDKVMNYFINVPRQITPVLRVMGPTETVTAMYTVVGQLMKYCSPMLYVQSKPNCPLPAILEAMIVPHFLIKTSKPVSPVFLGAVRDHLHLFMLGLSRLDYRRDPYLQRRLKDIISIYLTRFSLKSQGSTAVSVVHPLVSSLCESFIKSPSSEAIGFREHLLELIHCEYLQLKNLTVPQSASVGLAYVTEVLQRTTSGEVIARDIHTLLRTILEYVLLSTSSAMKQHAVHIMQYLVEACKKHPSIVSVNQLSSVLRSFLKIFFNLQYEGVLQIMEKLSLIYPDLMVSLISDMTQAVRALENKRGVGVDTRLRQSYFSVLQQLGELGQSEITALKTQLDVHETNS
ncbi:protein MMS22-like [Gigantopelta aegis]|uniref:protein MMS22-like n=1 Tax=Gigantopelta aegis TaxID=1735272 RepID=UPI001B889642|nr:protein MMS22-like [Gigantopelta aegis]XP_041352173.1 protein MMS22-like [Gigantopelta aegis]